MNRDEAEYSIYSLMATPPLEWDDSALDAIITHLRKERETILAKISAGKSIRVAKAKAPPLFIDLEPPSDV